MYKWKFITGKLIKLYGGSSLPAMEWMIPEGNEET